jgi:outer membrane receptor protein involved in Fe transport
VALLSAIAVLLAAGPVLAGPSATLTGRVTDTSGKPLAGVRVEATHIETDVTSSNETNPAGLYAIPNLPPGTYRVIVRKFAFRSVVKPGVELQVQQVVALNFVLELGSEAHSAILEVGGPLIQADAKRGGNFLGNEVRDLPLVSMDPVSLARTLPGVVVPHGSALYSIVDSAAFSVNGQRIRANNYLLDSTGNNDIAVTGIAQPFNITDAVEEVSVQTGNFGAELGRAGGGIFNVVTRSGTNDLRGGFLSRYQSERFNSVSSLDKVNGVPKSVFNHNVYGGAMGGPVQRGRTFFFGAFQQDTNGSTLNESFIVPTEAAVAALQSAFPSNLLLKLYLDLLGDVRGTANPIGLPLGDDPVTGVDRGVVEFATAGVSIPKSDRNTQWMARLDHNFSEERRITIRVVGFAMTDAPTDAPFPEFLRDRFSRNLNVLVADHYTLSSTWTNELRFSFARQDQDQSSISPQSVSLAYTLPRINIASISTPGIQSADLQFRHVGNFLFQESQTKLSGRHTFRYGAELLYMPATQRASSRFLGTLNYTASTGYSAFANYLDNFSGPSGNAERDFGATLFRPNQFHQAYFVQNTWLARPSLTLTMGLRYENFGQPANALPYPAFSGFDPATFLTPNKVNPDNNNFGPALGFAWAPRFQSGLPGVLFGADRTVWRGGFQVSYDPFFTQMLAHLMASSPPNSSTVVVRAPSSGRGMGNFFSQVPVAAVAPSPLNDQRGMVDKHIRNPYTERWSLGFQRQISRKIVLDISYVGSQSHKLTTWSQANPIQENGVLLNPAFGIRQIRGSGGNSSYHALQSRIERRFAHGFQASVAYTWSRNIDSTSEGIGTSNEQSSVLTSAPVAMGGLKLDRGPSDYDRPHRLVMSYLWSIPGPGSGPWKHALSGWSVAAIASIQSGAPFSVANGLSRGGVTDARPDIGNPNAPLNSRAVLSPQSGSDYCSTGYRNPDTDTCVNPDEVHWIQSVSAPNGATVGRNTLRAGGVRNLDASVSRSFQIGERQHLEVRCDAFNALNHPQFTSIPVKTLTAPGGQSGSPSPFLNPDFTDGGNRTVWLQAKFFF